MKRIFNRCLFLYIGIGLIIFLIIDHQKVAKKTMDTLNTIPHSMIHFAWGNQEYFNVPFSTDALQYYKSLAVVYPESSIVHSAVAFCYYHRGDYKKALKNYKRTIKDDNDLFGIYYNLGIVYYKIGQYNKSVDMFNKAVSIPAQKAMEYDLVIDPHLDPDTNREKVDIEQRMNALNQAYHTSFQFIVRNYILSGQYEKALSQSEEGLVHFSNDRDYYTYYAGAASYALGEFEKALGYFQKYLETYPLHRQAIVTVVQILENFGQSEQAIAIAEKLKILEDDQGNNPIDHFIVPTKLYYYYPDLP